jgi:hypothetical protein
MATHSEENNSESKMGDKPSTQSANVRFDLEHSNRPDDFDESLDEIDEFLELSTVSNPPSTPSFDSTANITTNGSTANTKISSSINDTNGEDKSTLKRYKRYVQKHVF